MHRLQVPLLLILVLIFGFGSARAQTARRPELDRPIPALGPQPVRLQTLEGLGGCRRGHGGYRVA